MKVSGQIHAKAGLRLEVILQVATEQESYSLSGHSGEKEIYPLPGTQL
jgi:hypothetical protein